MKFSIKDFFSKREQIHSDFLGPIFFSLEIQNDC